MAMRSSSRSRHTAETTTLFNMDEAEKVFKKFDENGDGKISISELRSVLTALNTATTEEALKSAMNEIDKDGDGFIDLKEFSDFFGYSPDADKDLREAFKLYDRDGNGKITAAELLAVMKSLGEKSSLKECKSMISSFDVDGDGCVNFEEFKKMMNPRK